MTSPTLFVITLTYLVPLERIDEVREAHWEHLHGAVNAGTYLAAGPQVPRTGGVILARGERAEIEGLVFSDPFITSHLASATFVEFAVTSGQAEFLSALF